MKRREMKKEAKHLLRENYGLMLGTLLLTTILLSAASSIAGVGFVAILFLPLEVGLSYIVLALARGQKAQSSDLFTKTFSARYYLRNVGGLAWVELWTLLWSLLFIVPGIVKSYSYAMMPYLLADHNELTAKESLKKSMELMKGKKGKLFGLHLSFFGYILGIAFLSSVLVAACAAVLVIVLNSFNIVFTSEMWGMLVLFALGGVGILMGAFCIFYLTPYIQLAEGVFMREVIAEAEANGDLEAIHTQAKEQMPFESLTIIDEEAVIEETDDQE